MSKLIDNTPFMASLVVLGFWTGVLAAKARLENLCNDKGGDLIESVCYLEEDRDDQ